jgi:transposase
MGNRRFEMFQFRHVIVRMRLGESDRDIGRSRLIGRKKAAWLRQIAQREGWLDRSLPVPDEAAIAAALPTPEPRDSSVSLVARHAEVVRGWWEEGIQGVAIHQALVRTYGFTGSYSSVHRFLAGLEAKTPRPTVMMDYPPGDAAQVDFGAGPKLLDPRRGQVVPTWFFVMTLCWSRHQYAEFVTDQRVATWLSCHRRALEWFGGRPGRLIIDNPKCAITKACYHDPEVQRSYHDFAEGYGFAIAPCPAADPRKKGQVESGVKYVKGNFLPTREFRDLPHANAQLTDWVLTTAGLRIHGTTKEQPLVRFEEVERALLQPLPDVPPQIVTWVLAPLHPNCRLEVERCYYTAPFSLIGKKLWVCLGPATVQIFDEHVLVAIHPRQFRPGSVSTVEDHLPPHAVAYRMQTPQWCLHKAAAIGPCTRALVEALFAHRVLDNLRAAQGVVASLPKRFTPARVEAACARALAFDSPKYRTVKTILEKDLDQEPTAPSPEALPDAYTGRARFGRDPRQMFLL